MTGARSHLGSVEALGRDRPRRRSGLAGILFRNEALKARKRPAFWVLTGLLMVFVAVATVATGRFSPVEMGWKTGWTMVPMGANMGSMCFALAVALLFAPEFKWRTGRQGVIDGLAKESFFAGKLLLSAVLALWFAGLAWAAGAAGLLAFPPTGEMTASTVADLKAWAGMGLGMAVWGGSAFCLAALTRGGAATVGILLGYYVVEGIAASIGMFWAAMKGYDWLAKAIGYLPGRVAEGLSSRELYYASPLPADAGLLAESPGFALLAESRSFALLAGAAAAYSLAFVAISFVNFRKRDL